MVSKILFRFSAFCFGLASLSLLSGEIREESVLLATGSQLLAIAAVATLLSVAASLIKIVEILSNERVVAQALESLEESEKRNC